MAVKKTVAAPVEASIPETASPTGELEASGLVTEPEQAGAQTPATDSAARARSKSQTSQTSQTSQAKNLAKARAAKAAKLTSKQASTIRAVSKIQAALVAEETADRHSFGEIKEVARVLPTAEEYVRVEIPLADLFDHAHPGVQLNRHKFEPGKTYMLRGDVALEVKRRLAMFHDEQVRLLRPNADRKALNDVNRGSQWTSRGGNAVVPLGRLEDVAIAADEKIYTVDF